MRHANVYQMPDRLLVSSSCYTDTGLLLDSEPYISLPIDSPSDAVGNAVIEALDASGKTVNHPTDWKLHSQERLSAAGVESELAFQRKAKLVLAQSSGNTVIIEPTHNGGTTGSGKGFQGISEKRLFTSSVNSAGEIGALTFKALLLCN